MDKGGPDYGVVILHCKLCIGFVRHRCADMPIYIICILLLSAGFRMFSEVLRGFVNIMIFLQTP